MSSNSVSLKREGKKGSRRQYEEWREIEEKRKWKGVHEHTRRDQICWLKVEPFFFKGPTPFRFRFEGKLQHLDIDEEEHV